MKARHIATLAALAASLYASAASKLESDGNTEWHYAVVASKGVVDDPSWRAVADALVAKYSQQPFKSTLVVSSPLDAADSLRKVSPRYVAFVVKPYEANAGTVRALHAMMKSLDDDPFTDAVWGIVTGPDADSAMRVAVAAPIHPRTLLSTTGVDHAPFDSATTLSDGYAPGCDRAEYRLQDPPVAIFEKRADAPHTERIVRGDTTHEFAAAWNALDPDLLVTSSHASQRNLEMPFSTGNIVARGGAFWSLPNRKLIDYSTGLADASASAATASERLADPARGKIWIAAGNCLIGDYADNETMAAAMLGFGHVVQFMGYVKTTWFGEIGWETLAQFMERGATVGEAWYFAGQNLERKLDLSRNNLTNPQRRGRYWDRDGTVLWGDPALDASMEGSRIRQIARLTAARTRAGIVLTLEALETIPAAEDKVEDVHVVHPFGMILPRAAGGRYEVKSGGETLGIFAADDFVLVTSWPAMKKGKKISATISAAGGGH